MITPKYQAHQVFSLRWRWQEPVLSKAKHKAIRDSIADDVANFKGEIQIIPSMPEAPKPRPHRGPSGSSTGTKRMPGTYLSAANAAKILMITRTTFLAGVESGRYPKPRQIVVNGSVVDAWKKREIKQVILKRGNQ
jgi:predicted DNA-binding transcriptional regulator AlpA